MNVLQEHRGLYRFALLLFVLLSSLFVLFQWGHPRFTQDRRQLDTGAYSYVTYDTLGRVVESGESWLQASGGAFVASANDASFPSAGRERVYMVYDRPSGVRYLDNASQRNLRNRVSYVYTDEGSKTHYSYDEHGNIAWCAQQIPGFPKTNYVKYNYDIVSGNVNQLDYNEGRIDAFHLRSGQPAHDGGNLTRRHILGT